MLDVVMRALKSPKPYKVKMLKAIGSKNLVSFLRKTLRAFFLSCENFLNSLISTISVHTAVWQ